MPLSKLLPQQPQPLLPLRQIRFRLYWQHLILTLQVLNCVTHPLDGSNWQSCWCWVSCNFWASFGFGYSCYDRWWQGITHTITGRGHRNLKGGTGSAGSGFGIARLTFRLFWNHQLLPSWNQAVGGLESILYWNIVMICNDDLSWFELGGFIKNCFHWNAPTLQSTWSPSRTVNETMLVPN